MIIKSGIELRDPFVIVENGIYYVYGTGAATSDWSNTVWTCYKNESGHLDGEWTKLTENFVKVPEAAVKNLWAPEVHKYKDSYYMFTTYYSSETGHRGCTILKSPSPEGTFEEITSGALLTRTTGGIYNKSLIFALPGSPNAVRLGLDIIYDEIPHLVKHARF